MLGGLSKNLQVPVLQGPGIASVRPHTNPHFLSVRDKRFLHVGPPESSLENNNPSQRHTGILYIKYLAWSDPDPDLTCMESTEGSG